MRATVWLFHELLNKRIQKVDQLGTPPANRRFLFGYPPLLCTDNKVTLLMSFVLKWSQWFERQPWVFTSLYRSVFLYHKYSNWMFFVTFFICFESWSTHFIDRCCLDRTSILDFLFEFLGKRCFDRQDLL